MVTQDQLKDYEQTKREWPWWNRSGELAKPLGTPRTRWKNMKLQIKLKEKWEKIQSER